MSDKNDDFTDEEKHLISSYLHKYPSKIEAIIRHGIYILPSAIFAVYVFFKKDFIASFVSWAALFIYLIWYLSYIERYAESFYSILSKYENRVAGMSVNRGETIQDQTDSRQ